MHTQSGYEKKVTANLHARIQSMDMEHKIYEVVIPMEDVVEFKNGKKQTVQRKVFLDTFSSVVRWTSLHS